MTPESRAQLVAEVRERLAEIDAAANPDALGGGWTTLHLRALVEEIDARSDPDWLKRKYSIDLVSARRQQP